MVKWVRVGCRGGQPATWERCRQALEPSCKPVGAQQGLSEQQRPGGLFLLPHSPTPTKIWFRRWCQAMAVALPGMPTCGRTQPPLQGVGRGLLHSQLQRSGA